MPDIIEVLTLEAPEEKTYAVIVNFIDEDDVAVTPSAATWTLSDDKANIINNRSEQAIGSLASTKTIVLTGDDLAIGPNGLVRHLLVEYTYTSSLGADLKGALEIHFKLRDFTRVQ